jgi:pyridinium-3,5-biscarboxylic acid mononucleotide sulfurtransferase
METITEKTIKLDNILKAIDTVVVAFSGGVDSTFLLHRAHKVKKKGVIGITVRTPYIPSAEITDAVAFTESFGIMHKILDIGFPEKIRYNPADRCYTCKKKIFGDLLLFAAQNNFSHVIDGTNADDIHDYRPGIKALEELGIRSPLLESGLTKEEIRTLSREADLDIWEKPAMACLLTRIPYDTEITQEKIVMVDKAETLLLDLGFPGTRVRVHGDLARIECLPGYIEKFALHEVREQIISRFREIGFRYVSLDLEGYRTGSSNL